MAPAVRAPPLAEALPLGKQPDAETGAAQGGRGGAPAAPQQRPPRGAPRNPPALTSAAETGTSPRDKPTPTGRSVPCGHRQQSTPGRPGAREPQAPAPGRGPRQPAPALPASRTRGTRTGPQAGRQLTPRRQLGPAGRTTAGEGEEARSELRPDGASEARAKAQGRAEMAAGGGQRRGAAGQGW